MSENENRNRQGKSLELVLYKYNTCGYCRKVMNAIDELQLTIEYRDILRDPGAMDELRRLGGKTQVPCLGINGLPLYESSDIIRFLEKEVIKS